MKLLIIIWTLFFFTLEKDSGFADVDRYTKKVDKQLKNKKLTKKFYPNMSHLGGAVTGYYLDKKMVLIKTSYGSETGYHDIDFYIRYDSLIFVKEVEMYHKNIETTEEYNNYLKKHPNETKQIDVSKLPLTTYNINYYYISDTLIIGFELREFNKTKPAFEDEIAQKNKMILEHLRAHLIELNFSGK